MLLKKTQNVLSGTEVSQVHHALLVVVFVCMTLLCSAVISVRAFANSASSSLPLSSKKIFLQWKKWECKMRNLNIPGKKTSRHKTKEIQPLILKDIFTQYVRRHHVIKRSFYIFLHHLDNSQIKSNRRHTHNSYSSYSSFWSIELV